MTDLSSLSKTASPTTPIDSSAIDLSGFSSLELAQALADHLAIRERDWHRLKGNRSARAQEQAAVALVYLLKQQPEEALPRLQQAVGWLDKSISAPPCPSHGDRQVQAKPTQASPISEA
ncbi:DUF6439 family protein [Alkalinema sp. FACHB-956]|uniref:DUF6439 family protein n=1 Tax=Alkalinema sp. FACHB-956 TaxID=2692768 RepID=UPI00241146F8|nr:DUF6439 family protein [Alkalinema sp. FACHB-956]